MAKKTLDLWVSTLCLTDRTIVDLLLCLQVPKPGEGHSAHAETPQEVLGAMKQVSYKTEIIGGVPIITATQVTHTATCVLLAAATWQVWSCLRWNATTNM